MTTFTTRNKTAFLCGIVSLTLSFFVTGGEMKETPGTRSRQNTIEIRDFTFNPRILTVKAGEKIRWINRDEEPHTIVSVEKQFKKSSALDTDQEFTITVSAPGTYNYFCSVHPQMTGTIVVEKP